MLESEMEGFPEDSSLFLPKWDEGSYFRSACL